MIKLINSTFFKEAKTKKELCNFIMQSKQLSLGKQCDNFEEKFAQWQGRKYCVTFNSGSSANLALVQALLNLRLIKQGSVMAYSAITWPTNIMPAIQLGIKPVPVDIEIDTLNISLKNLQQVYRKKKFSCLFITNLLGFGQEIFEIKEFCNKNRILLIEDNCEALGSEVRGEKLGNFGFASTFSFFVGHHLSTIEGGAVCTDNEDLFLMLKMVRSHGWDRSLSVEVQKKLRNKYKINDFFAKYTFYDLAYNIRPTEIQGFLGSNQLQYLNIMVDKRQENFKILRQIYQNSDFIPVSWKNMTKISNFAFPIICKTKALAESYRNKCMKAEVEVRPLVGGLMAIQPFYKKYYKTTGNFKNAIFVNSNGFYFGNHAEMKKKDLVFLVNLLKNNN
jgi:CDP-6-deoxy-D-xylo-4-hexulose-3-dehydrase